MDFGTLLTQGGFGACAAILGVICRELWKAYQRQAATIERMLPVLTEVNTNLTSMNEATRELLSALAAGDTRQQR